MKSLKIDPERRVRLSEAALAARVSRQLVYSWVRRGLLAPLEPEAGEDSPRYRLGDVQKVELATRRSGCSSRAKTWLRERALAAAADLERERAWPA